MNALIRRVRDNTVRLQNVFDLNYNRNQVNHINSHANNNVDLQENFCDDNDVIVQRMCCNNVRNTTTVAIIAASASVVIIIGLLASYFHVWAKNFQ